MLKHCQIVWFLQLTQNIKTRVVYEWPASNTHVVFASGTSIDWQDNKRTRNALFKDDASDKADSKEWQAWRRTSTQGGVRCVRCSNMMVWDYSLLWFLWSNAKLIDKLSKYYRHKSHIKWPTSKVVHALQNIWNKQIQLMSKSEQLINELIMQLNMQACIAYPSAIGYRWIIQVFVGNDFNHSTGC